MYSLSPLTGTLGVNLAKHLLRRATFRYTKEQVDNYSTMTVDQAVDDLFTPYTKSIVEPIDVKTNAPWINAGDPNAITSSDSQQKYFVVSWWMNEARLCPSIDYKLQWFLHSMFITDYGEGNSRELFDYIRVIEYYCKGSIREFAKKMTLNNLMLRYLNGNSNTKNAPNENYAREFLELFTITKGPQMGPGNYTTYTEDDVQTAAKLLTGWKTSTRIQGMNSAYIDMETNTQIGYPTYNNHTTGNKVFSSNLGNASVTGAVDVNDMKREVNDFVDVIFNRDATAIAYSKRMYRFFVSEKIDATIYSDIILPLSTHLKMSNYNIESTMKLLLKSQHFYDKDDTTNGDNILGGLVRSPMEQILQALTFFNITIPDQSTAAASFNTFYNVTLQNVILPFAGMKPYAPDSVAGYPAYFQEPGYSKNWFDSGTLIARYKLFEVITSGNRVFNNSPNGNVKVNLTLFVRNSSYFAAPQTANLLVMDFCKYLLPIDPSPARFQYFLNIFLDNLSPMNWQIEWQNYLISNNDASVKIPINRLVKVILSSQEFQLF